VLTLLLGCAAPADSPPPGGSTSDNPPQNLLIITMDTTRRDLLGRYGGDTETLAVADTLAAEGLALDQHRSCSNWTMASMMCLTSGLDPLGAGYLPSVFAGEDAVASGLHPLAERLSGFSSHLVTANSWFTADHGLADGFETEDFPADRSALGIFETGAERVVEAQAAGATRWYLHLHLMEPHSPYAPPDAYLDAVSELPPAPWDWDLTLRADHYEAVRSWNDLPEDEQALLTLWLQTLYEADVRWMNDQMAEGLADFEAAGLLRDTLVVLAADHGEQFFEHGEATHAHDLTHEENDSFAVFWAPGRIAPQSWTEPTSHEDIMPTVLQLLGEPVPEGLDGRPVGDARADRVLAAFSNGRGEGPMQSVLVDGWKLLYRWGTGQKRLYDLRTDPLETEDLYLAEPERAEALWEELGPRQRQAAELLPDEEAVAPGP